MQTLSTTIAKMTQYADKFQQLDNTVRFDLPEGSIFIHRSGHISDEYQVAACSFRTNLQVLNSLLEGYLDPMSSIVTGKLKFAGDIQTALKLKALFN